MGLMRLFLILAFLIPSAIAQSEKEKIFSTIANASVTTRAKIRRGTVETLVDLASPSIKTLVKDYDVIMLEEGVYNTLGNFTAKYVRIRGKGPRKTFVSSMAKGSAPILVNSTEFWDMTIADAKFKLNDQNGLWAVNVEFAGPILVRPANLNKSPAFAIRSVFSDITNSQVPTDNALYSHFLTKHVDGYLMPLPGDAKELLEKPTAANLLAYEDKFDNSKDINLKNRIGYKGLFARGLNYLYQKEVLSPKYDQGKYNLLVKNAKSTKAQGHLYVALLYWAEADRMSGHARFDDVLREITPLTQSLGQECGCTVEGQGIAKTEIEDKLYTQLPITALPGRCKIQTFQVNVPAGSKKETVIAAARVQAQMEQEMAFKTSEDHFDKTMLAHAKGEDTEEVFLMAAEAPATPRDYTAVADVEVPGAKKTYTIDYVAGKMKNEKSIDQSIIEFFTVKFASRIKTAKKKLASSVLVAKVDGFITQALYGDDPARQVEYENLHEQQFGRKLSAPGAMSSVFAY